ncbi:MAG TPA: electron transfer flavoprotein subunit beta/FixA family protein [Planctomycetota bacterium]|nr:electron transfer flavoprotein subunit beta/FixA family protein [Planctomycetota bacterium]
MDVVVCIKRVPATDTRVKVAASGRSIDPAGVQFELNPYDEFAVEEALRIKEKTGGGTVTVIALGPAEAQKELRNELARGADKAVLLRDDKADERDAFSIATALAEQIRKIPCQVAMMGKQAVDRDNGHVGTMVATMLGWSCVNEVVKVEISGDTARCEREVEGGAREVVEAKLPAVLTAQKGLNEPRYVKLPGIMAAKKKPLEEVAAPAVPSKLAILEMHLPAARQAGRFVGKGKESVGDLLGRLRNEAKVL